MNIIFFIFVLAKTFIIIIKIIINYLAAFNLSYQVFIMD